MIAAEHPAQAGHNPPAATMTRDCDRLTDTIAKAVGQRAAVSWVHAGALLSHARTTGYANVLDASPVTADGMLRAIERIAAMHPALFDLQDPAVVELWNQRITDDQAAAISRLWSTHSIADPDDRPHGYLLGNVYQSLSAESRKSRALCQTPRYISDLLIDLTMRPAWSTWPITEVRMIDPSCGTGHILVETLLATYQVAAAGPCASWNCERVEMTVDRDAAVEVAVGTVHGVDLEPYTALLARYRLLTLTAALLDCPIDQVPAALTPRVAAADALLGKHQLLDHGQYGVVLGNPPYITPKTAEIRDAVRAAYPSTCHMKYALSLPFHELMNNLLMPGGWCAQLTANSFMKREFGAKYVENYLAGYDLEWVIDTSGAYIPGHGTPTVILVNRNRPPVGNHVHTVLGNRGEPRQPEDASQGLVWNAIARGVRTVLAKDWVEGAGHPGPVATSTPVVHAKPFQDALFELAEVA